MQTTIEQVERLMASVALTQEANGEWTARVGAMSTIVARGKSKEAASASLRKKLERVIGRRPVALR